MRSPFSASLIFSKYFYLACLTNYYTFYLIQKFHLSVQGAQFHLFLFLFAVALGTILGGPIGDRYGRKLVIWVSILGVAPFTIALPHANLFWTGVLTVVIGVILASAFSAILVYAQELVPGKVGLIAGLFFGLAFGMAGIGSAVLGEVADRTSIEYVFHLCSFLPLIGLLTAFLPERETRSVAAAVSAAESGATSSEKAGHFFQRRPPSAGDTPAATPIGLHAIDQDDLALIRPLLGGCDQTVAHWVVAHIFPLLRRSFRRCASK